MTPQPAGWAAQHEATVSDRGHDASPPPLSLVEGLPVIPGVEPPATGARSVTGAVVAAAPLTQHGGEEPGAAAFAVWTLGEGTRSPSIARSYTHSALRGWNLEELDDSIAVAVSEMVTNAMCHNQTSPDAEPQPVLLSLARQDRSVLCVVVDAGTSAPEVREPVELAESGRGLPIVECLSDDWGWTVPGPAGKAVWATFSTADSRFREHCRHARTEALSRVLLLAGILRGTENTPPQPAAVHAPRTRSYG